MKIRKRLIVHKIHNHVQSYLLCHNRLVPSNYIFQCLIILFYCYTIHIFLY